MAPTQSITHIIFLIFTGTAVLSTLALFTRQSLLVMYIALGAMLGPWGLKLVKDPILINQIGDIGIVFLLFLLGLNLQPQNLLHSLRKMSWITVASSLIFFSVGCSVGILFKFTWIESILIGITMMFSSTIIVLKLLPTTILHHQHTGELMISILLLQDIIAIVVLFILHAIGDHEFSLGDLGYVISALPLLLLLAFFCERFILTKLFMRFDKIHEYIFILSIGWCLCLAEISHFMGLPEEIGAFIAGIVLASNPISLYIAENLKPLRDFFLVLFFFAMGATFEFNYLPGILFPAVVLAFLMLIVKPYIFSQLLRGSGEIKYTCWEIGVRLGQASEFSLLIIYIALQLHFVSTQASYLIQATTIITFIVSCYWVMLRYPTPLASIDRLRRD